ncbi:MAG: nicotinate-nucleotide adenylyltransferase [Thermodesulfovibrionales bacterium]|nr:nicotinate-nucleotide adenylyltransferase [Thermodesulfovibrionales bacterium]
MKIGIFGGTFNPIHIGHLRAAEEVRQKADLDKILFIPSGNPPLKTQGIVPADIRYEMVKLAIKDNDAFEISDIEIADEGRSFSVMTIQRLLSIYDAQMFFILGIDSFCEMPFWHQPERLLSMIDFILMTRPGISLKKIYDSRYVIDRLQGDENIDKGGYNKIRLITGRTAIVIDITQLDISSSMIRQLLATHKSIRYLVPDAVYRFIEDNGLYK